MPEEDPLRGVRGEGVVGRESEGHLGRQSRHSRDPSTVTAIHGDLVVQDSFLVGVKPALTASSVSALQSVVSHILISVHLLD